MAKEQRKSRLIKVGNKTYYGIRNIVIEVIKRAGLDKYTYEDVILSADGELKKFAPYLKDQDVKRSLWALQHKRAIKRCGTRNNLAIYCGPDNIKKTEPKTELQTESVKKQEPDKSDEITAKEFGERMIRYIGILNQKINQLEADLREEKHLHGKVLSAWKEEQSLRAKLERENKELHNSIVALGRAKKEEAAGSTFKLSEMAVIK